MVITVFVGAEVAEGAEALTIRLADGSVGVEAEAVFAFEEVGEGEVVGGEVLEVGEVLVVQIHGGCSAVVDSSGHCVDASKRVDVGEFGRAYIAGPSD